MAWFRDTMMHPARTLLLIITFVFACQSCSPFPAVAITSSPQVASSETPVAPEVLPSNTRPAENTPFPTHTAPRPTSTRKSTLPASVTPIATTKPTNTPTFETTPGPLTERKPSVVEVGVYIGQVYGPATWTDVNAELIYQDMNGDGSEDLIYNNSMEVAILLWLEDGYYPAYHSDKGCGVYSCSSRLLLEDWTGDAVPEALFDWYYLGGGSDLFITEWYKNIISCHDRSCQLAWSERTGWLSQETYMGGMVIERLGLEKVKTSQGPAILAIKTGFQLATVGFDPQNRDTLEQIRYTGLFTETVTTYQWNGVEFNLQSTQDVRPDEWIEAQPVIEKQNANGDVGMVRFDDKNSHNDNRTCTILINQQSYGSEPFDCKEHFTTIEWQDVTADGQPELLVRTITPNLTFDLRACVSEHVLIFSWDGQAARLLADVSGCVMDARPDAFGVRIINDGKGPAVIQVANETFLTEEQCQWSKDFLTTMGQCWVELAPLTIRTFEWNGVMFVQK